MSKFRPRQLCLRSLVADVLPFEVPLTFTNDFFFSSTLPLKCDPQVARTLGLLRKAGAFTIPLNYDVVKERGKSLTLSIPHPIAQLRLASLIDDYAETIISYCEKSEFSLRRPAEIVSLFSTAPMERSETSRDGLPHDLLLDGSPDFSRMASFFRLKRFNLLAKFVESEEYIELEKQYSRLLTIDIAKCFYNIYTHSLGWAIKGKGVTKKSIRVHSFEHRFDEAMQFANYKETNGIIVGPEVSRIFAELILQHIDSELRHRLMARHEIAVGEYQIRRYVDDYSVFANDDAVLDKVETELAALLGEFKLYINSNKRSVSSRPFVTPITRMKHSVSEIVEGIATKLRAYVSSGETLCDRSIAHELQTRLRSCRIVLHSDSVGFHNISGWLMWKYRSMLRDALRLFLNAATEEGRDCTVRIVAAVFESVFYVTSLDFRVRTGFNLAVLVNELRRVRTR